LKIRIKFSKHGPVRFVGHLDMMRYFQKAIRRADLDIVYTKGFSPHQVLSFAQPLGVGLESDGEYFDIELNSKTNSTDIVERLNNTMADGVTILSAVELPDNAGNAMASVAAAKYQICFREGFEYPDNLETDFMDFMKNEKITVTKQTKKSEIILDLKPSIFEYHVLSDRFYFLVDASSAGNIKPTLIVDAFYRNKGLQLGEFDLLITRMDTYGKITDDEIVTYKPLEEFGSEF